MQCRMGKLLRFENFQIAWERVAANGGGAGVDRETIEGFARNRDRNLRLLQEKVAKGEYRPMPLRQVFIPKKTGGWRELGIPTVRDRIVQQVLLEVLRPLLEPQFEQSSYAYRSGRSHLMAVERVATLHKRGYQWVLDADIVKYFNNVLHQRAIAELAERLDCHFSSVLLDLVAAFIEVGVLTSEGILLPKKGLSQGSAISPILANVYLDDFDEAIAASGLQLVRYADDFVILGRKREQIERSQAQVRDLLDQIGLQLHPEKTQLTNFDRGFRFLGHTFAGDLVLPDQLKKTSAPIPQTTPPVEPLVYADNAWVSTSMQQALVAALKQSEKPIPPPLYVVLGYSVREVKPVTIESHEAIWKAGMSTLYLVQQGATLRKEQGLFVVQPLKESAIEIPIREVQLVLVFGNIQLTTAAIAACLDAKIPVIFLTQMGEYKGQLWNSEFCDLPCEEAQWQRRQDGAFQLQSARAIVWGKLMNSKQLLLRLNRKRLSEDVTIAIAGITADLESVETTESLESLRGYEGIAANRYFAGLGQLITNEGFSFTERNRRPPKDPFNSLLSFGYTLLYNNVLSLILAEGLNPYLGNLHRSDRKETHLAFDLMEEFRSPVVDTLVMNLVNKKALKPTDFTWFDKDGGVYLTDMPKRIFLKAFEDRVNESVMHPDVKEKVSYRRAIQLQIKRYKKSLLDAIAYEAFLRPV
jgi:CRISP-associated protein Cas1